MTSNHTRLSKFLSYILRHHPEEIGLEIDRQGWAHLPSLIRKAKDSGRSFGREEIETVMHSGQKKRFTLSPDGQYIRAGYGHSIEVELDLEPRCPPELLYHGTARKHLPSIRKEGIHSASRQMVHLSANRSDAQSVGSRHGKPVILEIQARRMHRRGIPFYQSDSGTDIWLTDHIPLCHISQ